MIKTISLALLLCSVAAAQVMFPITLRDSNGNIIFQVNDQGEVTATKFTSTQPTTPVAGSLTLCQPNNVNCQVLMLGPEPGLYIVPDGETLTPMHKVMTRQEFDNRMKEWFNTFKAQP